MINGELVVDNFAGENGAIEISIRSDVMERLTKRINFSDGTSVVDFSKERVGEFIGSHEAGVRALFERLVYYEDLQEQGKLLILPCEKGDTVYCIMTSIRGIHPTIFSQYFDYSMVEYFGKSVFLTKEQTEEALKEMESDMV